ncbi:MAG: hypothetical protein AB7U83_21535 [Vicinamibacterales bacterium]
MPNRVALLCLVAIAAPTIADASRSIAAEPVGLVARVAGAVTLATAEAARRPVQLFDRLAAGDELATGPQAEVLVVFRSGVRVRLAAGSRARVAAAGLTTSVGTAEHLPPLPPLPVIAAVADAGAAVAAVRVRTGELTLVSPADGLRAAADSAVLRFVPAHDGVHDVELEDAEGRVVFQARVSAGRVAVPADRLAPERRYHWRVRSHSPAGFRHEGRATFATLSLAEAKARAGLLDATTDDATDLALRAELDYALGLWPEALAGFQRARDRGADAEAVGLRIATLERRLAGSPLP